MNSHKLIRCQSKLSFVNCWKWNYRFFSAPSGEKEVQSNQKKMRNLGGQNKVLSLKEFMVRSEIIDLYRKYMKLGRLMSNDYIEKSLQDQEKGEGTKSDKFIGSRKVLDSEKTIHENAASMKREWNVWVRAEFHLRSPTSNPETGDLESIKAMLSMGRKQYSELESSIRMTQNLKPNPPPKKSTDTNTESRNTDSRNTNNENGK